MGHKRALREEGGTFLFVPWGGTLCSMGWNTLFHGEEYWIPLVAISDRDASSLPKGYHSSGFITFLTLI